MSFLASYTNITLCAVIGLILLVAMWREAQEER